MNSAVDAGSGASTIAALLAAAVARIDRERIYRERAWLTLLHYRNRRGQLRSDADSSKFFLAAHGATDARDELHAAVIMFTDRPELRCRFPARFTWLQQRLGLWPDYAVLEHCPALRDWYAGLAAPALSIHFAAAYLDSPSSMFGHTFLRFHTAGAPALLTPTVNYAANTAQRGGDLDFVVRGLFGGFPGTADQLPYFRRLRIYADNEGRDIWEYRLNLDAAAIDRLLLHLWEVKDEVFDYYFLDENCAYRTLALLAAARPELDLLADHDAVVVPIDTIRTLQRHGLIAAIGYWPSSVKTLEHHTADFSAAEFGAVRRVAAGMPLLEAVAPLAPSRRAPVLAAAAEYLAIRINRDEMERATGKQAVQDVIRARLQLEPPPVPPALATPAGAERAHRGALLSAALFEHGGDRGIELGYAGFEHTLTDALAGYEAGAEVRVLSGRYRVLENGEQTLERIDWLRVQSQIPVTALFPRNTWALHFSRERKSIDAQRPLLNSLGYSMGRAVALPWGVAALSAGLDLDQGAALRRDVGVEGLLRVAFTRQRDTLSYEAFYQYGSYLVGDGSHRDEIGVRAGLALRADLGVQLEWRRGGAQRRDSELQLALRYFF